MPVSLVKVSYNVSLQQVERGKQSGGSVSLVVVGHGAAAAFLERQDRLGPIERLYLALLIDAKHDGLVRRIQVEPDHVGEFFQKPGVARELEILGAMWLEIVTPQDVTYCRLTHSLIGRHRTPPDERSRRGADLQLLELVLSCGQTRSQDGSHYRSEEHT